jgi:hypothetical protein
MIHVETNEFVWREWLVGARARDSVGTKTNKCSPKPTCSTATTKIYTSTSTASNNKVINCGHASRASPRTRRKETLNNGDIATAHCFR